jgi:hypothetical protein
MNKVNSEWIKRWNQGRKKNEKFKENGLEKKERKKEIEEQKSYGFIIHIKIETKKKKKIELVLIMGL